MLVAQNDFESYVLKLQISTSVKQPKVQQHRQHNTTQTLQKPNVRQMKTVIFLCTVYLIFYSNNTQLTVQNLQTGSSFFCYREAGLIWKELLKKIVLTKYKIFFQVGPTWISSQYVLVQCLANLFLLENNGQRMLINSAKE